MRDLTKLAEGMDKKVKEMIMSKVKDAAGGMRQMSSSDISDMGDMVKDMNIREMKNLNASVVCICIFIFDVHYSVIAKCILIQ